MCAKTLNNSSNITAHIVAFLTIAVWGTTFVWTKLLLMQGLSPAHIFTLRFLIAYLLLLGYTLVGKPQKMPFRWRDELTMAGLGLTGGSLYFLTENASMLFTTATNTSLIVCACPLFAMLLIALCYPETERLNRHGVTGSLLALIGMAIVVLNGHFVLHLSPLGDLLAFAACMSWAVYSLLMKRVSGKFSTLYITRKMFFYGLLSILPYYLFVPELPPMSLLLRPSVWVNLLFLGCVASMVCYLTWNWCMMKLGAVTATNWVYFNPITTIFFAWLILDEHITPYFLIGTACILCGIYLCSAKR